MKRPEKNCYNCEFFSAGHPEIQKIYDWPSGWCRFNQYQTDELQTCYHFLPNDEYRRLNKFFDLIESGVD